MSLQNLICRHVEVRFCKDANIFNFRIESMTAAEIRARDSALSAEADQEAESVVTLELSSEAGR